MTYRLALLSALVTLPAVAQAGAWESKTSQEAMSSREVERSLAMPKGWLEFSLGADVKQSTGYWSSAGEAQDFEDTTWLHTTEWMQLRYGLTRRIEVYGYLPFHYLQLTNDVYGTDISGFYLGDPRYGVLAELLDQEAPTLSVVARVELKAPAGNESPGSYIGGPASFSQFVTTTAGHDLTLGIEAKQQFGPLALGLNAGYVHRFSGLAQFVIETAQNQLLGRIKAGDRVYASASVMAQGGPAALVASPYFEMHRPVSMGTSSGGLSPDGNLVQVEGSGGWSYGVDLGLVLNITRNWDLVGGASIPLRGEDLMFFPIEDIHPTRGNTFSGALKFRY